MAGPVGTAIHLLAGSIASASSGSDRPFNTSVLFDPDGEAIAIYRKIHMFDVDVGGVAYRESEHEQAGEEIVAGRARPGSRSGSASATTCASPSSTGSSPCAGHGC